MFNLQFLSLIRAAEFQALLPYLANGTKVLEIGGGTGEQAALLQKNGFDVISIDLPSSNYSTSRCFPVKDYDGKLFPVMDDSVDIVFSSNVLEHIADLTSTHSETKRVLKPGGFAVHIMPTHSWRIWTGITHYCDLIQRLIMEVTKIFPNTLNYRNACNHVLGQLKILFSTLKWGIIPPRHGERGSVWSEASYFHPRWWVKNFQMEKFEIVKVAPMGIFYTGHMFFGNKISISSRKLLSKILGSACYIYVIRPKN